MTDQFWLLSRPSDVPPSKLDVYLEHGEWVAPDSCRDELQWLQVGDRVALKSNANRKRDLPFFSDGDAASVMTVFASGTVTAVAAESGHLTLEWSKFPQPRDWFFLTYMKPLVRVEPNGEMRRQLGEFIFDGANQDLSLFLADSFWGERYVSQPRFTWIPIYEAIATRLLDFADDRTELLAILGEIAGTQPLLNYLMTDQYPSGPGPLSDIDPFTVMGTFNRGVTNENRRAILQEWAVRLGVHASLPDDFDGLPTMNNQKSWFFSYAVHRTEADIPMLWQVFKAALALASEDTPERRQDFAVAYDAAQQIKSVRWNLSQGLYWARPRSFVTLDGPSRVYIREKYKLADPTNGLAYLQVRDAVEDAMASSSGPVTSLPLLSFAAWWRGTRHYPGHDVAGLATWAGRLSEDIDLDAEEHAYKRVTAVIFADAHSQAVDGDALWTTTFLQALRSTNTFDFRFVDDLKQALLSRPTQLLEAFNLVWQDPRPESLDAFQDDLGTVLGKLTPGNATQLGAWLLMSIQPEDNAPYSPTRTVNWYRLTGFQSPGSTSSATIRYATMLSFLDQLVLALREKLHEDFTRLEAQGAAWLATEHGIPKGWSTPDRDALRDWRLNSQSASRRAWLMRPPKSVQATQWLDENYVSLPASKLGNLAAGSKEKAVKEAVDVGYQHIDYSQRQSLTAEYFGFLTGMSVGDLIAIQADTFLHVGEVESDPEYVDEAENRLHRGVNWLAAAPTRSLASTLSGLLDLQGNLVDITQGFDDLEELMHGGPEAPKSQPPGPTFPSVTQDFAHSLNMDVKPLQEIADLLFARRQIVFYGPPGTGKTYLARKLARFLVGPDDNSRVQLVQFHPSYAYEDFFEGFRPAETASGDATFKLTAGPMRRICEDAGKNPDKAYVLLIDEMNRANLAKVFGELYFLLEYRRDSVLLQYSPKDAFTLPSNLYVIGTMNTADRSIALLDAAMRRRFSFVELHPEEPPVKDVLQRWLTAKGMSDERARLLAALNAAIEDQDRDLKIGPSYLMREEAATEEGLERVWKYDIMPLLEEHYYGRLKRSEVIDKFGLEALRRSLKPEGEQE